MTCNRTWDKLQLARQGQAHRAWVSQYLRRAAAAAGFRSNFAQLHDVATWIVHARQT